MGNQLTFREASQRLGASRATLKRMLRDGQLPEAQKVRQEDGWVWVIPEDALERLSNHPDLVLDIRDEPAVAEVPTQVAQEAGLIDPVPMSDTPKKSGSKKNTKPKQKKSTSKKASGAKKTAADRKSTETAEIKAEVPPMPSEATRTNTDATQNVDETIVIDVASIEAAAAAAAQEMAENSQMGSNDDGEPVSSAAPLKSAEETKTDHRNATAEQPKPPEDPESVRHLTLAASNEAPTGLTPAEVIDMALLDRLLGIQEAKTEASCRAEQAEYALEAANSHYSSLEDELKIERHERSTASERLREERLARKIADVKIAELSEQLVRETNIAETERKERVSATNRTLDAEQKASYAIASMNWFARKRFLRSLKRDIEG